MTVSRVLNGEANVRPETRERVEAAIKALHYTPSLAARTLEESRGITRRLRPVELERLGFDHALEAMIAKVATTAGLRVFKEVDDLSGVLSAELQLYVYRLVQEGLNNVVKHSGATTASIDVKILLAMISTSLSRTSRAVRSR